MVPSGLDDEAPTRPKLLEVLLLLLLVGLDDEPPPPLLLFIRVNDLVLRNEFKLALVSVLSSELKRTPLTFILGVKLVAIRPSIYIIKY